MNATFKTGDGKSFDSSEAACAHASRVFTDTGVVISVVAAAEPELVKFVVGKTYSTRSIGDSECIFRFTILARTAKTVTIEHNGSRVKRGLSVWNGAERFSPFGKYSFSPSIRADKEDRS